MQVPRLGASERQQQSQDRPDQTPHQSVRSGHEDSRPEFEDRVPRASSADSAPSGIARGLDFAGPDGAAAPSTACTLPGDRQHLCVCLYAVTAAIPASSAPSTCSAARTQSPSCATRVACTSVYIRMRLSAACGFGVHSSASPFKELLLSARHNVFFLRYCWWQCYSWTLLTRLASRHARSPVAIGTRCGCQSVSIVAVNRWWPWQATSAFVTVKTIANRAATAAAVV